MNETSEECLADYGRLFQPRRTRHPTLRSMPVLFDACGGEVATAGGNIPRS